MVLINNSTNNTRPMPTRMYTVLDFTLRLSSVKALGPEIGFAVISKQEGEIFDCTKIINRIMNYQISCII